uniref:Uncharacterized protein n=1 Tax=Arundo donax TaxID=35708 RepID=A0A0A9CUG2_ARUDO
MTRDFFWFYLVHTWLVYRLWDESCSKGSDVVDDLVWVYMCLCFVSLIQDVSAVYIYFLDPGCFCRPAADCGCEARLCTTDVRTPMCCGPYRFHLI